MTEKLKQIAKDEILKLPKETQEAINAYDWAKVAEEIGKKFLLTENEINDFQTETMLVLMGLEEVESYPVNIENNVGTTKDDAEKIADEANEKIFAPISNILTDNIKKNLKNKNPDWEQTVNFILSGGDYSVFIEDRDTEKPNAINPQNVNIKINNKRLSDMRDKFTI